MRWGLASAVLLCTACAERLPSPPVVLGVSPSEGPADSETAVSISGEHFAPRVVTDFSGSGSLISDDYVARVGLDELLSVVRVDDSTLTAVVPGGLVPGQYDLTVTDPYGRETVL